MKQSILLFLCLAFSISLSAQCGIVISEIMYNPDSNESTSGAVNSNNEWIEIVNTDNSSINLSGWTFTDGDGTVNMPAVTIPSGGVMVLGDCTLAEFNAAWGPGFTASNYQQIFSIKSTLNRLANSPSPTDEIIQIFDNTATLVDEVNYDDAFGWPNDSPDGSSIYINPCSTNCTTTMADLLCAIDNNVGTNWGKSTAGVDGAKAEVGVGLPFDGTDIGSPGSICGVLNVTSCVAVPALSEWGLIILSLLLLNMATMAVMKKSRKEKQLDIA